MVYRVKGLGFIDHIGICRDYVATNYLGAMGTTWGLSGDKGA